MFSYIDPSCWSKTVRCSSLYIKAVTSLLYFNVSEPFSSGHPSLFLLVTSDLWLIAFVTVMLSIATILITFNGMSEMTKSSSPVCTALLLSLSSLIIHQKDTLRGILLERLFNFQALLDNSSELLHASEDTHKFPFNTCYSGLCNFMAR